MTSKAQVKIYLAGIAAIIAANGRTPSLAGPPAIYSVGTLGGSQSSGAAINLSGQITGWSFTAGDVAQHAFLYTGTPGHGGLMTDLGSGVGSGSVGQAINGFGQIAGSIFNINVGGPFAVDHAFLYSGGAIADLGQLGPPLSGSSSGNAINASGQIAGTTAWQPDAFGPTHAFLYTGTPGSGGVMHDLGALNGTIIGTSGSSSAGGINDHGQVVGESYTGFNDPNNGGIAVDHAFLYTGTPGSGGAMADLGSLAGKFGQSSATAVNASGQVTGGSDGPGPNQGHAFLYSGVPGQGGAMADLGTLGGSGSFGTAINNSGQVVGSSELAGDSISHLFFYTGTPGVDGHMIDLNAWLNANDPTEGAKWTLTSANGLTDTGLIVGTGNYNDGVPADSGTRAFLLDASALVPEPGSISLLALGGIALLRRRRF